MKIKVFLEEGKDKYFVYLVTNKNKKDKKRRNHSLVLISSQAKPSSVLSQIRATASSPSAKGGNKEMGLDMKKAGKGYKDKFRIARVGGTITKDAAERIKSKAIAQKGANKTYNHMAPI